MDTASEQKPPAAHTASAADAAALLLLLALSIASACLIDFHAFSDDQKTYIRIATDILARPVAWNPSDSFAWVLAGLHRFSGNWTQAYALVYGLVASLYLLSAYLCLRCLRLGPWPALAATLVSLVPHYTLGMTFWGFAGAEFVTARIMILPLATLLMSAFLRNRETHRAAWIFPLAAAGSFLHLSSAFLFSLLFIAYGYTNARAWRRALQAAIAPLLISIALFAILAYRLLLQRASGGLDALLLQIYETMAHMQSARIDALDPVAGTDLLWQAAYAGFWWTMFPPRLGDVAYVLAENALLLAAAWFAWRRSARSGEREAGLAHRLTALALGVVVTAYGLQAANFFAWKLASAAPHIFEEVRAFGFLYWPIYVAIGFAFAQVRALPLRALLFLILLLSPTAAVRALPETARLSLRAAALQYGPSNLSPEYLEKALGLHRGARQELDRLSETLRTTQAGGACRVISLEHELKRSGCAVFVSYQDKRSGRIGEPGRDALPIWFLSYEEIRPAIESGDPERIANIAARYGANLVVLPRPVRDARFLPVFSGTRWHAYRIGTGNGAVEARPS
jgi:hypothetical protein